MAKTKNTTEDTYSYKGWLVSDYFIKRMIAVWFYDVAFIIILFLLLFTIGLGWDAITGVWD